MSIYVNDYEVDGFKQVCQIECDTKKNWSYFNINESLMYSDHRSWVYFIVEDVGRYTFTGKIVKVGETGLTLGLKNTWNRVDEGEEAQPICNTKSRLGRLRRHPGGTDGEIRFSLYKPARDYKISIWAKPCEITKKQYMIGGKLVEVCVTSHKDQELIYLDHIKDTTGSYPCLNVGRK